MVVFLDNIACTAISDGGDSSDDEQVCLPPRLKDRHPSVVLAAHNGIRFDIPILISECWRNGIPLGFAADWLFVDTLDIVKAVGLGTLGGCGKLQCLMRHLRIEHTMLAAHSALDDCYALRSAVECAAELHGLTLWNLVRKFTVSIDVAATCTNLSVLL